MTIEVFDPPGFYTIATAGPHEIPFPYATGAVIATIVTPDGLVVELDPDTDFTVDPAENLTGAGDLTLSGAIFTEYEGAKLYINRDTSLEQGWLGQMTREKGLEAQLDATVMAVQEQAALRRRILRSTEPLAPIAPGADGEVLMWDGGNLVAGPTASDVAGAQAAAEAAIQKAAEAAASAAMAAAFAWVTFFGAPQVQADSVLTYAAGQAGTIPVGATIGTRADGFSYTVAPVVVADHDLQTAGGVKLYANAVDGKLSLGAFVPAANDATDDAPIFRKWLARLKATLAEGWIPRGAYLCSFLADRTLTADLTIQAHSAAVIRGAPTNDKITGTGVETSAVASWTPGTRGYSVSYWNGATEVKWTAGVQYTVAGATINWAAGSAPHGALAAGHRVRIWSSDPILEFGASTAFSHRFAWQGGIIDNSDRGYILADASGSGLTIYDFAAYDIEDTRFLGAADHVAALADLVADSGFTALACNGGWIENCYFRGQADLGVYITGGGDTGPADNGFSAIVTGCLFERCQQGVSAKRDANGILIDGCTFRQCYVGATLYPTTGDLRGGRGSILNCRFFLCGIRPIDVRRCAGITVQGNVITDFGYELDGVTPIAAAVGINAQGIGGGSIKDNLIQFVGLSSPADAVAFRLNQDTTETTIQSSNVDVSGNKSIGVAIGCREGGSGTGNTWDNDVIDATTPIDVPATRKWRYRPDGNTEIEGVGSTPFEGTFTPTFLLNGATNAPVITTPYASQDAHYARRGNSVHLWGTVQTLIDQSEPANRTLLIQGAPAWPAKAGVAVQSGEVNLITGITLGAGMTWAVSQVPPGGSNVRLYGVGSNGVGSVLGTTHMVAGAPTAVRVDWSITYEAEPLAPG
jgi:hypothetical protein